MLQSDIQLKMNYLFILEQYRKYAQNCYRLMYILQLSSKNSSVGFCFKFPSTIKYTFQFLFD